jgi:hypothetical protein
MPSKGIKPYLIMLAVGIVLLAILLLLLAQVHNHDIDPGGWFALVFGGGFSILIGGGLVALMFFASRSGYDDRVQTHLEEDTDEPR